MPMYLKWTLLNQIFLLFAEAVGLNKHKDLILLLVELVNFDEMKII